MKPFRTRLLSLVLHVAAAISLLSMAALAGDAAGIGAQALEPIPAIVPGALATQKEDSITASGRQEAEDPGAHLQNKPAITHDDTIAHENMADLSNLATFQISWETIPNLVYSGTEQNTIRLSNVPYSSAVTVTYKKNDGSTSYEWSGTSPSASTEFDILPLTDAGDYYVTNISVINQNNSVGQIAGVNVTIAPQPVSVPSAGSHTYSQQSVTAFTVPEDSLYTMTEDSKQYNTQINAGTYPVSFELEDKTNYIWGNQADVNRDGIVTVEWTILPKAVPVPSAWSDTPVYLYTGSAVQQVTYDPTMEGASAGYGEDGSLVLTWNGDVVWTVSNARQTNAGEYTSVAALGSANFCWEAGSSQADTASKTLGTWTILPKNISLAFDAQGTPITTTYSGKPVPASLYAATIGGVVSGDSLPGKSDIEYTFYTDADCTASLPSAPVSAGEYWVKASVNSNSAVNPNYSSAEAVVKLVINPNQQEVLTVLPHAYSGTYDGLAHPASGGMEVKAGAETLPSADYTIYYSTTQPNEGLALDPSAYQTEMPSFTNAGSQTVYYLVDTKNYRDVAGIFTVSIDRAELTLEHGTVQTEKVYDGTATAAVEESGSIQGIQSGDSIQFTVSANYDSKDVQTAKSIMVSYTLRASAGVLKNYYWNSTEFTAEPEQTVHIAPISGTITPCPVTVTIGNASSLYGQDIQDLTWQISHGSMAHGEDLEIVLETTAAKDSQAGTYSISVKSYDDNVAANYDLTVQEGTYTIGKAGLSLSFGQETLSVPADGTAHNPLHVANSSSGATLSNLPADVTVAYTSTAPQVAAVDQASGAVTMVNTGDTTITATVTDGGQNFTGGSSASYTLHVTLAEQELQVSVQPKALTYTGLPQALVTAQVTFPTDRQVSVEYSLDQETYGTAIPTATDAGTYTVYWRASANGYADANGSQTVTVNQKPITTHMIGGVDSSYAYTGQQITVPTLTVTDGGTPLVYGRDYTVTYGTNLNPGIDGGSVRITGMGNYTGQVEKTFSIHIDPGQPGSDLELTVTPDHWTYTASPSVSISVGFNGTAIEDYCLTVSNAAGPLVTGGTVTEALSALVEPGTYTVTANGTGAYANASDTVTVTVARITPTVHVTAAPASLSGSGKITLTLSGSDLPTGTDLTTLLTVSTANGAAPDLSQLTWSQRNGIYTAALPLSNANETYTFTLAYPGDAYHSPALDRTSISTTWSGGSSGGGSSGGGTAVSPVPEDPDNEENTGIADPDDTGVSDWLITENHVQYLGGYGGGLFGPADHMTRAQVAQMFYHLLQNQNVPVTACFTDVPESAWCAPAINTLASLGILNGTTDTLFAPNRPITRAEFVVIAMRFAQADAGAENTFSDVQQQDWFYEQVLNAVVFGWINGYSDGTFRPGQTITRAEVAVITNRILGRSADKAYLDAHADQLVQFDDVSTSYWAYYDILEAANTYGPVS